MAAMTKSPPWETFAKELRALFDNDPYVDVGAVTDCNNDKEIRIFVTGHEKCQALSALIPTKKTFGNVVLFIHVHEADTLYDKEAMFRKAFECNGNVSTIVDKTALGGKFTYIAFKPKVAQFFDDNIADLNGQQTMLMEDIARDVFGNYAGFFFCTDKDETKKKIDECPF